MSFVPHSWAGFATAPVVGGVSGVVVRTCSYGPFVPRLSEFYGIAMYMYWVDHPPPHFHAFYSGDEAVIAIDDGSVIAGSIPTTALRLVREWLGLHRSELEENWYRASRPESLVAIEPLR